MAISPSRSLLLFVATHNFSVPPEQSLLTLFGREFFDLGFCKFPLPLRDRPTRKFDLLYAMNKDGIGMPILCRGGERFFPCQNNATGNLLQSRKTTEFPHSFFCLFSNHEVR